MQYQLVKLTSLGSLFGLGLLLIKDENLFMFFYVIPFISFSFDLLIFAESFNLKRMSVFLRFEKKNQNDVEFRWENFIKDNPSKLATIGNNIITLVAIIGSSIFLISRSENLTIWFKDLMNIIWLTLLIGLLLLFRVIETKSLQKNWINETMKNPSINPDAPDLSDSEIRGR